MFDQKTDGHQTLLVYVFIKTLEHGKQRRNVLSSRLTRKPPDCGDQMMMDCELTVFTMVVCAWCLWDGGKGKGGLM